MPNLFMLIEAVNSVALSHPSSCDCVVCRAADGDDKALFKVTTLVNSALVCGDD